MGKKLFLILIFLSVFLFLLFGCIFGEDREYLFAASFSGSITDEFGLPLSGVEVSSNVYSLNVVSNENGYYSVRVSGGGSRAPASEMIVTFSKKGFVPIHKIVSSSAYAYVLDVQMFEEATFQEVDVSKPVSVSMSGAALSAEKESFVVKGTSTKASSANISLTPFDPADEKQLEAFPGDFTGTQKDGTDTAIESYSFMKIQVEDDNKNKLDLQSGKTAEVTFPIGEKLKDFAPDTIPLWYFDPEKGKWVERGVAKKVCEGGTCVYKGSIDTIASWWNCDAALGNSGQIDFSSLLDEDMAAWIDFISGADLDSAQVREARINELEDKCLKKSDGKNYDGLTLSEAQELKGLLGEGFMIQHLSKSDVQGEINSDNGRYGVVKQSKALSDDAERSAKGAYKFDNWTHFKNMFGGGFKTIWANAFEDGLASVNAVNQSNINFVKAISEDDAPYQTYDSLIDYSKPFASATSVSQQQQNVEYMYNKLQQTIRDNQWVQYITNYGVKEAIENAAAVCSQKAVLLAAMIDSANMQVSVVTSGGHTWTRVTYVDGTSRDLDPNQNYDFLSLPIRNVLPTQIIRFEKLVSPGKLYFSSVSDSSSELITPEEAYNSRVYSGKFCTANEFCAEFDANIYVLENNVEGFEFLAFADENTPVVVSIITNPDLELNSANPTAPAFSTNLFGSQEKVYSKEFDSNYGEQVHYLITGKSLSAGKSLVFVVVSPQVLDKNILEKILGKISYKSGAAPTQTNWKSVLDNYSSSRLDLNLPLNNSSSSNGNTTLIKSPGKSTKAQLVLQGVDYASNVSKNVTLLPDGDISGLNTPPNYGKPNGNILTKLAANNVISEGIPTQVPALGQITSKEIDYAGVIVPFGLSNLNANGSITINFVNEEGSRVGVNNFLYPNKSTGVLMILIRPDRAGKIVARENVTGEEQEVSIPALGSNEIIVVKLEDFNGKKVDLNKVDSNITYLDACPLRLTNYRIPADVNKNFMCNCSSSAYLSTYYVYGDTIYYLGSDLCKSAIHAGVIDNNGGPVLFTIRGRQNRFISTNRNGITSNSFAGDDYSVVFNMPSKFDYNVACSNDYQCNDNNSLTVDTCLSAGTASSSCQHSVAGVACSSSTQCGTNAWIGTNYCNSNNVWNRYRTFTCNNAGTTSSVCVSSDVNQLRTTCASNQSCVSGFCIGYTCSINSQCDDSNSLTTDVCANPGTISSYCQYTSATVACSSSSQCGTNAWVSGTNVCTSGNVFQNYRTFTCNSPGTVGSSCSDANVSQLKTDCGVTTYDSWGSNYCDVNLVKKSRVVHNKGCSSGACTASDSTETSLVETCAYGCSSGTCNPSVECVVNADCGVDGFVEPSSPFCGVDLMLLYREYKTYTCTGGVCSYQIESRIIQDCPNGCNAGACNP